VANLPAAVTDTHALIFHASGHKALGSRAASHFDACERQQALLYVPMAVVWETSLLVRANRITLHRSVREFFDDLVSNPAYRVLELTADEVFDAGELVFTRDPFDALICATARRMDLPLVTRDGPIRASGAVRVLW
jgi:PIN domain nuclease of toxin-antitoxin system